MDIVQIISFSTQVLICLIGGYVTYRISHNVETLKSHLKTKTDKDDHVFKLLLGYEDQKRTHYMQHSREFLITVQQLKDETKNLLHLADHYIPEEVPPKISALRERIVQAFSVTYLVFTDEQKHRMAHAIKSDFLQIYHLMSQPAFSRKHIEENLSEISLKQKLLAQHVNEEVNNLIIDMQKHVIK